MNFDTLTLLVIALLVAAFFLVDLATFFVLACLVGAYFLFGFPAVLVLACLVTGVIWLLDATVLAPRRRRVLAQVEAGAPGGQPPARPPTLIGRDKGQADEGTASGRGGANHAEAAADQEPPLVEYSRSFFPVILIVLLLRSFLVEPFQIPSGSMMPTLLVGDFILVNKFAYGLRWPVLNTKFLELGDPQRGDVVVFRFPKEPSVDYIKRVVGAPGDRIAYRDKTLYINGELVPQRPAGRFIGVGSGADMTGHERRNENLAGVEHSILVNARAPDFAPGCYSILAEGGSIEVPQGSYFVMGDNRDNSNDSRCWGFVPEGNLVGKAFAIWMNWDLQLDGFPIDWGRLGNRIN